MTVDRFRTLIEGAVALWQAEPVLHFEDGSCRCHVGENGAIATVACQETRLGNMWRIETPGRTPRGHRSVVPALATLRELICPGRPRGRALFVTAAADDA